MKKIALASLLLAASAVVGFAQDAAKPAPALKLSGFFNTGLDADISSSDTKTYVYGHTEDFGGYGSTFKLVGTYDADTWGYTFRLRDRGVETTTDLSKLFNFAYGWVKPFDGVTVYGGKLGLAPIGALDYEGDVAVYTMTGAQVVYSVGGLSVGAAAGAVPNPTTDASDPDNVVHGNDNRGLMGAYMIQYSLPKAFTVEAHLTTGYDAWNGPSTAEATNKVGGYAVTASIDAIDGLTLNGGYNVYNASAADSADVYTLIDANVAYTVGKVTLAGYVGSHSSDAYGDWVQITPSVAYALTDAFTLGANVDIYTADASNDNANFWGYANEPEGKTAVPSVTATYAVGGSTTKGSVGYDVGNKTYRTYIDFAYSF